MTPKRINLALQGGGAHGAFTWGVLDRLLEEDRLEIASLTGTSAGAVNAAAYKAGLAQGGRDGAKQNLEWLWSKIGAVTDPMLSQWLAAVSPDAPMLAKLIEYSPAYTMFDTMSRMLSPYQFNAIYQNPLDRILRQMHYPDICAPGGPDLFICATNVRSGKIRVFTGDEVSPDAILASACLPTLFQAVEIDDPKTGTREAYWDGGYTGNPALFPLFADTLPSDILIVNINPLHRERLPKDSQEIVNRINEISFNSSLLRELRAIHFVQRLLETHQVENMKRLHIHMIADDALMNDLSVATKTVPTPVVLSTLRAAGRTAADQFLTNHWADIGTASSVDLPAMFG